MKTRKDMAEELARGLGISFYLSPKGRITQHNEDGLSEEIRPPPGSTPTPLGVPEVKSEPSGTVAEG